jgi:hypothetical protein
MIRANFPLTRRTAAFAALAAILGLLAADGLVFRTGLYTAILEPDSAAGIFGLVLQRERAAQAVNGDNLVLTLGDSRFAYSPKAANLETGATGLVFRQGGIAGTNERVWYYMLRELDPTARRYRAIVFGATNYDDEDEAFRPADDLRNLHYLAGVLRYGDILEFANSFEDSHARWSALRAGVLKGVAFDSDVHGFLSHPVKRLQYVALCRKGYAQWTYDYLETPRSMAGLAVDWKSMQVTSWPADLDQDQRDTVQNSLMRKPIPQTGQVARYRGYWYGKILERYRGSPTRMIFVRLPRGPIARPPELANFRSATIRDLARRPGVALCDEHAFDELERPELFRDGLHLNRAGIAKFSKMLAWRIAEMLSPGR